MKTEFYDLDKNVIIKEYEGDICIPEDVIVTINGIRWKSFGWNFNYDTMTISNLLWQDADLNK